MPNKKQTKMFLEHLDQLRTCQGMGAFVAIHPHYGIVASTASIDGLARRVNETIKKKVGKRCSFFDVDECLSIIDAVERAAELEGTVEKTCDDNDSFLDEPIMVETQDEEETPAKDTDETISELAARLGVKATEVLIKALEWGHKHLHLNVKLDPGLRDQLELTFSQKVDGQVPPQWAESPHPQPAFDPAHFDPAEAVIDGASRFRPEYAIPSGSFVRQTHSSFSRNNIRFD